MRMNRFFAAMLALFSGLALAHGEDKPGPHGGFIRMPGAFHTEVVPTGDRAFSVFLVDMKNAEPLVEDSGVSAKIRNGKVEIAAACAPNATAKRFDCVLPEDASLGVGELRLEARRAGVPAMPAVYSLPLRLR